MLDDVAREMAATSPWLAETPAIFRDRVVQGLRFESFDRGHLVYGVDDPTGGLWFVAEGSVGIEVASPVHGVHTGHVLHPGAWLGERALIMRTSRLIGVRTLSPCRLGNLPLAAFSRIAKEIPETWRWLSILANQHQEIAIGVASDLMIRSTERRIAAVLLRLAGCRYSNARTPAPVLLSQADIARLTALSRAALGRHLERLEGAGLIRTDYRAIEITDLAGLRALIKED